MKRIRITPIPVQEVGKAILKMLRAVGTMDEDEGVIALCNECPYEYVASPYERLPCNQCNAFMNIPLTETDENGVWLTTCPCVYYEELGQNAGEVAWLILEEKGFLEDWDDDEDVVGL